MNIYELAIYVNKDVDDTFELQDITRWFNKAIANYNLIPPITKYPFVWVDNPISDNTNEFEVNVNDANASDGKVGAYTDYPGLDETFMLAVMLPFISASIKNQESSITEKQILLSEFVQNATAFKAISNIPSTLLYHSTKNTDIDQYQLGENVYISDMRYAPFSDDWSKSVAYFEIKDKEE